MDPIAARAPESPESYDLARASRCIPNAILPWDIYQSFVQEDALRDWGNAKAVQTKTQTRTPSTATGSVLYSPIRDPFEIRVLELRPGVGTSRLECALHHSSVEFESPYKDDTNAWLDTQFATSLAEPTEPLWYTALSYTWGLPIFDRIISVNSQSFNITTSLYTALLYLRHPTESKILWIDQICIDQANSAEKEQQVPLMSRIYSHALNTTIWLGEPRRPAVHPFETLQSCAVNLWLCNDITCPQDFDGLGLPAAESEEWADVWHVLSAPYFSRVWIIQELILSRDEHVACGRYRTLWRLITDAAMRLEDSGVARWLVAKFSHNNDQWESRGTTSFDYISYLHWIKFSARGTQQSDSVSGRTLRGSLISYLTDVRPASCRVPHDKIYGLLGLEFDVNEGWSGRIKPRYDAMYPVAQLFYETAVDGLTHGLGMRQRIRELFCAVDHAHDELALEGLPSWVPDWTRPRQTRSIMDYKAGGNYLSGLYAAGGKLTWKTDSFGMRKPIVPAPDYSFVAEGGGIYSRGLRIKGKSFDTVEKLTDIQENPDLTHEAPEAGNIALLACYTLAKNVNLYPGAGTAVFNAFWRTLIANKDGSGRAEAPETYAEIFSLLLDATTGHNVDGSPSLTGQTYSLRQRRPAGRGRLELMNLAARKPAETFKEVRGLFRGVLGNRRFGLTQGGRFGLFPGYTTVGDAVCVFGGVEVPFVVRDISAGSLEVVNLVGECYVHGVMKGDVIENEEIAVKTFVIL